MTSANLTGVPETMLWTLHNRASESKRPGGIISDPACERIYDAIDYDYERSFGRPDGVHAMRSKLFDGAVRPWLADHPSATVVELGAGLETQFQRCDNGSVRWLCVDVPESIEIRERFLPATDRCRHLGVSALDSAWLDEVADGPVFVTAQGLFMYFEEQQVHELVTAIFDRFDQVTLMFDAIPPYFARKTLAGHRKNAHYTVPPMPWGIKRDDIEPLLRRWVPRITDVTVTSFAPTNGPLPRLLPLFELPILRNIPPSIALVRS
ncbi:class I SAM-dependent methyltransferase [Nocardia nepalensis]|uniref:class I SAM-dependent methyltransferase n=1 Tax=Nocardia nepalensis TaxID=3375448 RepID=UPI003B670F3E